MKLIHIFIASLIIFTFAGMNSHAAEKDYQIPWCKSQHGIYSGTAVTVRDQYTGKVEGYIDCLTATHAVEVDYDYKWKESKTQAEFYAMHTGKRAGILLILTKNKSGVKNSGEKKLRDLIKHLGAPIDIWVVPE